MRAVPKANVEALKKPASTALLRIPETRARVAVLAAEPLPIRPASVPGPSSTAFPLCAETDAVSPPPAATVLASKTLAADVTGTWKSEFDSQIGHQKYTFTFKQDGTKLTGKANSEVGDRKREAELKEGKVDGDTISFVEMLSFQGNDIRITYPVSSRLTATKSSSRARSASLPRGNRGQARAVAPAAGERGQDIRIKAGQSEPVKDAEGNVWLADQGFEGGQTIERPDIQIANTKSPDLYRAERYSMDSFSWPVPNGKYLVNLHFAETFEGIYGPGERVFSFNVQGQEFKDFDVWVKAGGPLKAYVESVPVEVTDGKIQVTFTPKVENPQICAIEIIPQSGAETSAVTPAPATAVSSAPAEAAPAVSKPTGPTVLQIDAGKVTGKVSPMLYGLMTEELISPTRAAFTGNLYATAPLRRMRFSLASRLILTRPGNIFRLPSNLTPSPGSGLSSVGLRWCSTRIIL